MKYIALCLLFFFLPGFAHGAQILLPTSDQATGSWSTTPGWSKIDDDSTAQSTGDGTTFQSEAVGNNTNSSNYDFKLGSGNAPSVTTGHILRVRWNHDVSGRTLQGNFELWQGVPGSGTLIATLQVTPDVTTTENTATYTLTGAEAGNISDYSDLYGRLWGRGTSGGPSRPLIIDLAEFEIPDGVVVTPPTVTTGVAGNISPSGATLFGNITDIGGGSITQHGFATSTDPTLTTNVSTTTLGSGAAGEYSGAVLLSASDTTYYYRAYARNSGGTSYGAIRSFYSGNANVTRSLRLFAGFMLKLLEGRIILY